MLTDRALRNWFVIPFPGSTVVIQITHFVRLEFLSQCEYATGRKQETGLPTLNAT